MIEETNKISPLSAEAKVLKVETLYITVYNNNNDQPRRLVVTVYDY